MSGTKRDNPVTLALLLCGASLAVGFAAWNISRALRPPAPPAHPAPAPPGVTGAGPAAPAGGATAGAPAQHAAASVRPAADWEASLAPNADPFLPIGVPASPGATGRTSAPPVPALPPLGGGGRLQALPPIAPPWPARTPPSAASIRPLPLPPGAPPALTQRPEPQPELVGTMLGDRPSAVLRSSGRTAVVPVGERLGAWRLLSVEHGSAVLRSGRHTVRLVLGGDRKDGIVTAVEKAEPSVPQAPPPAVVPAPQTDEEDTDAADRDVTLAPVLTEPWLGAFLHLPEPPAEAVQPADPGPEVAVAPAPVTAPARLAEPPQQPAEAAPRQAPAVAEEPGGAWHVVRRPPRKAIRTPAAPERPPAEGVPVREPEVPALPPEGGPEPGGPAEEAPARE